MSQQGGGTLRRVAAARFTAGVGHEGEIVRQAIRMTPLLAAIAVMVGCGHYPAPIRSWWSIKTTPASEYMVVIDGLPLADWPRLAKFHDLRHFGLAREYASTVTDNHAIALSKLDLPRLRQVSLAYASQVTDKGLNALTNFPAIQGLQLIAVAITDRGIDTIATGFPHLDGINVEECRFLTPTGFLALAKSPTIKDVGLSLGPLSQADIESVIAGLPNIARWTISDPDGHLSIASLRTLAAERRIMILVSDKNNCVRGIEEAQP